MPSGGDARAFTIFLAFALGALLPTVHADVAVAQTAPSVQLLHVVPGGTNPTPGIDTSAVATMDGVQAFLSREVGRTLRVTGGVTQVAVADGDFVSVINQLTQQGYDDLNTIHVVFADMEVATGACGTSTLSSPTLPSFAILWMPACGGNYPDPSPQPMGPNATFIVLHELLHALGAVQPCAPNHDGTSHVNDSNRDVLYQGSGRTDWSRNYDTMTIDTGNDDYYNHSIPDCFDLADSPYWDDATPPPPSRILPVESDVCALSKITINMNTNGGNGRGTADDDVILGTPGRDLIIAGGGNDVICGGSGIDYIYAGPGQDVVFGGGGSDRIYGQGSIDILFGGSGADRMFGGHGNDRMFGQGGKDSMWGQEGNDDMQGNHQSDRMWGGPDNDVLRGAGGKDKLRGGDGNDRLFGGDNQDYLEGGPGRDVANGQRGRDNPFVADISGCQAESQQSC